MFFSTCSAGALSGPDFCFIFAHCRIMSCPLGTISKRPRLKIRLEDILMGADGEQPALLEPTERFNHLNVGLPPVHPLRAYPPMPFGPPPYERPRRQYAFLRLQGRECWRPI